MKLFLAENRGVTEVDWLKSYHSFSFADYYDPSNKGWGNLRVINEDYVAPGAGFEPHYHRDMEIVTYMISGALEHKDSAGNEYIIHDNEIQRISAGSGILHSEYNHHQDKPVIFFQLWVKPNEKQTIPSYEQKRYDLNDRKNKLKLIASLDGREDSLVIKQDLEIYVSELDKAKTISYQMKREKTWIQLFSGSLNVNGEKLKPGDGLAVSEKQELKIESLDSKTHFLLFDVSG